MDAANPVRDISRHSMINFDLRAWPSTGLGGHENSAALGSRGIVAQGDLVLLFPAPRRLMRTRSRLSSLISSGKSKSARRGSTSESWREFARIWMSCSDRDVYPTRARATRRCSRRPPTDDMPTDQASRSQG
jgi:hypothetical protein